MPQLFVFAQEVSLLLRGRDSRQLLHDICGVEFGSEFGFASELFEHVQKTPNGDGVIWRDVLRA